MMGARQRKRRRGGLLLLSSLFSFLEQDGWILGSHMSPQDLQGRLHLGGSGQEGQKGL